MDHGRRRFLHAGAMGTLWLGLGACSKGRRDRLCTIPEDRQLPPPPIGEELRLTAFGDWGSGDDNQARVACGIERAAAAMGGVHAGLLLGDNFYPEGVTGVDDPKWQSHFEEVYATRHLGRIPWWAVLGNHDWRGDAEAQIAYTARSGGRWNMPDHFYETSFGPAEDPLLTVLALDTDDRYPRWNEQQAWFTERIRALYAESRPVVVVGHHTIVSYARHGATDHLVERIKPLLEETRGIYLCGHDHCLQLNHEHGAAYAVLGGGGANIRSVEDGAGQEFAASSHGFGLLRVTRQLFTLEFRDEAGDLLHSWRRPLRGG